MTLASRRDIEALFIDGDELLDAAGESIRGHLRTGFAEANGVETSAPAFTVPAHRAAALSRGAVLTDRAGARVFVVRGEQFDVLRQVVTLILEEQRPR